MDSLDVRLTHPLRRFALDVAVEMGRETVALVGPSGAGKTTVLRAVAGLLKPAAGRVAAGREVWFDSERGIYLAPERRSVGLVFQDYALFPHLTVERNVAFGARRPPSELLEAFGIAPLVHALPRDLSGGEQQRVALARALAREPSVLLLDEPLSSLDPHTRGRVRAELRELLDRVALPTLLVTHDFGDAAALASRVGVLVDGALVQIAAPAELVAAPASPFVADFTGGNLLEGEAGSDGTGLTEVTLGDGTRIRSTDALAGRVGVIVYPWDVALGRDEPRDSTRNRVRGEIATLVPVGNRVRVRVGPLTAELTAESVAELGLRPGETVVASWKATGTRLVPL